MTIGIAAYGPAAGLAVFQALRAVEQVGRGAIGGFASFVAITADARLVRAETQRGGTRTLFVAAETTGVAPPPEVAQAYYAGVMSSGPDRPLPLSQFTPADPAVGLLTGHRLPNVTGADGQALNSAVLQLLRQGWDPASAVHQVLAANPEADAGLIALDRDGRLVAADTAMVERRPDRGRVLLEGPGGCRVAVLHNAIQPYRPLAQLAAQVALDTMHPADRVDHWVTVSAGIPLVLGKHYRLQVDGEGRARQIEVSRPALLQGRWNCAPILLETVVEHDGELLGHPVMEPYGVVENGRLVSLSGQPSVRLGIHGRD